MFRGREMAHPERGEQLLNRLADELGELAVVEQRPQQDGRNMVMMLAPSRPWSNDEARDRRERRRRSRRSRARRPSSTAPGSAEPAEISPEQI